MAKKAKAPQTPFDRLVKSHETQLRRLEIQLADQRKVFEDEQEKLKKKIAARREVLGRLKS